MRKTGLIFLLFITLCIGPIIAQERAVNLQRNPLPQKAAVKNGLAKTTTAVLSLPFFEDFTGYDPAPDPSRWMDHQVYVNNTMCVNPISRGVATFDALDENGYPWDPWGTAGFRRCDSLTSAPINLSLPVVAPADSVYLSFYYQPQGNGFYPLIPDSLILMFRTKYGGWETIWKTEGTHVQPFKEVMIPITDSLYFSDTFQFRFINIASLNLSDAIWNIDYIRLDKNRTLMDTAVSDIAFTANPSFLLNDYTSMPYRQFLANNAGETAPNYYDSINNTTGNPQPVTYWFTARALNTGTILQSPVSSTPTLSPGPQQLSNAAYTTTIPSPGTYDRVVFENKYYIESTTSTGSVPNDTIIRDQVFDNYLAYDDGSAEQAYYLNLYPTQPGKVAVEYHLNAPDTMQGLAIYFGRQVPDAPNELFDIVVYSALAGVNGAPADDTLLREQLCSPGFVDTLNHFWIYKFSRPLYLPAGTFYAGTVQPADFGSDSLYFGLDINRRGGNHGYYNVVGTWEPSVIAGALMMRPLLGQEVTASSSHVNNVGLPGRKYDIYPNPATDKITFTLDSDVRARYTISNIQGQLVSDGSVTDGGSVDISSLVTGIYIVNISVNGIPASPVKIVKQ